MLNLRYKTSFPKNPNQSRELTELPMPNSALRLCAARLYYFYDVTKPWLQNVYDKRVMVCIQGRNEGEQGGRNSPGDASRRGCQISAGGAEWLQGRRKIPTM